MPQQRTITTNQSLTLSELTPHVVSNVQLQIKRNKTKQQSPTLWISGPPGLGKSEWMEHICREQGWGLVVVFISQMTIDMLSGMPMIKVTDDGDTEKFVPWSTPEIFNFRHLSLRQAGGTFGAPDGLYGWRRARSTISRRS